MIVKDLVACNKVTFLTAVAVGVWWAANIITAVSSKIFMQGDGKHDKHSWSDAILDFRWLELTVLQHLLGAVVSILWLKIAMRKNMWPADASMKIILLASLGNVAGNMAINAAYAMVSSSMAQVVKACEPLFMFGLSLLLYRDYEALNSTTFLAIVIMVIGAALFVAYDSTFLVSGLLAVLCSNVAFPIRNIYLKKLSSVWESSFQKYAAISMYSVLILTPIVIAKMIFFQSIAFAKKWQEGFIASSFHCTYNIASIYVLQNFTPLTHAILNLLKRGIVIVVNLVYFQLPLSWKMIIGLAALLVGLCIYMYKNLKGINFKPPSIVLVLVAILLGLIFFVPSETVTIKDSSPTGLPRNVLGFASDARSQDMAVIKNSLPTDSHHATDAQPHDKAISFRGFNKLLHTGNFTQHILPQHNGMAPPFANGISSAWVFDRPISSNILSNLQTLSKFGPVMVYCGTSRCMQAISDLHTENISTTFLLIGELVQDTPFEDWLARHTLHKVLALTQYEDHLQEVVRLAILWKYGGLYIEPNVDLKANKQEFPSCSSDPWIGVEDSNDSVQHFNIACFPKQSKFIKTLSSKFVKNYYKPSGKHNVKPSVNLDEDTWNTIFNANDLPKVIEVDYGELSKEADPSWNHHYGTLSYDTGARQAADTNVGNEIQGYPGLQFLPFLDNFLERDNLPTNKNNDQHITAFFNALWGSGNAKWPPQPNIDPILLSVHIASGVQWKWKRDVDYLKQRAPIGCRDYGTLDFLTKTQVPAFFSGYLTLLMQMKSKRTNEILVADVNKEYFDMLPAGIKKRGIQISHNLLGDVRWVSQRRFTEAFQVIERYSKAKLVITQQIHSALLCVAMGTPVIFINSEVMSGGGGGISKRTSSYTIGLASMFHTLDIHKTGKENVPEWFAKFPWDNPPPNPDMATHMRLRATFWYEIRKRPSLYDAGRKFGLIPMTPPTSCVNHLQFHIHFPHPDDHFTWQDHRSVESIFHHHPCASVLIHSNTLNDERFDVFRESGYMIQTMTYDHKSLIGSVSMESQSQKGFGLQEKFNADYLIAALVLHKWGGVYIDSNIILTKSLRGIPRNFIVWASPSKEEVDASFMGFEKGSKFLELVAAKISTQSDQSSSSLYTQAIREFGRNVETLNSDKVFVFDKTQVSEQCYEVTSGPEYDSWRKTIAESAVAVALSSDYSVTKSIGTTPLKADTLCRMLLYDFCVMCSKLL